MLTICKPLVMMENKVYSEKKQPKHVSLYLQSLLNFIGFLREQCYPKPPLSLLSSKRSFNCQEKTSSERKTAKHRNIQCWKYQCTAKFTFKYDRTRWPKPSHQHIRFCHAVNKLRPVQFVKFPTRRKIGKDLCPVNEEK